MTKIYIPHLRSSYNLKTFKFTFRSINMKFYDKRIVDIYFVTDYYEFLDETYFCVSYYG